LKKQRLSLSKREAEIIEKSFEEFGVVKPHLLMRRLKCSYAHAVLITLLIVTEEDLKRHTREESYV